MKLVKLIFAFLFIVTIFSCKKVEDTSLKVTVYDEGTKKYLANRHIALIQDEVQHPIGYSDKETIVKEAYTDANGKANFGTFTAIKGKYYNYFVRDYSPYDGPATGPFINAGADNNVTITEDNPTLVSVNFSPPPPYPTGDYYVIQLWDYVNHPGGCYWTFKSTDNPAYLTWPVSSATYTVDIIKYENGTQTFPISSYVADFTQLDTTYNININVVW